MYERPEVPDDPKEGGPRQPLDEIDAAFNAEISRGQGLNMADLGLPEFVQPETHQSPGPYTAERVAANHAEASLNLRESISKNLFFSLIKAGKTLPDLIDGEERMKDFMERLKRDGNVPDL